MHFTFSDAIYFGSVLFYTKFFGILKHQTDPMMVSVDLAVLNNSCETIAINHTTFAK
jgi:hypothetical protein